MPRLDTPVLTSWPSSLLPSPRKPFCSCQKPLPHSFGCTFHHTHPPILLMPIQRCPLLTHLATSCHLPTRKSRTAAPSAWSRYGTGALCWVLLSGLSWSPRAGRTCREGCLLGQRWLQDQSPPSWALLSSWALAGKSPGVVPGTRMSRSACCRAPAGRTTGRIGSCRCCICRTACLGWALLCGR